MNIYHYILHLFCYKNTNANKKNNGFYNFYLKFLLFLDIFKEKKN